MLKVFRTGWRELTHRPSAQMPGLDALRTFAVVAVICSHYAAREWVLAGGPAMRLRQFPLFWFGWTGVDLFFILSGFLIGKQLWQELEKTGTVQVVRFWLRRGFRIWPLYFATLIALAVSGSLKIRWSDYAFLSNYLGGTYSRNWSLSTEEQFYIGIPVLLILTTRLFSLKAQVWPLLALLVSVPIVRAVRWHQLADRGMSALDITERMSYPIHLHCEALIVGLLIALVYVKWRGVFLRKSSTGVSKIGWVVLATAVPLGALLDIYNKGYFAFLALGLIFGAVAFFVMVDESILTQPLKSKVFYPLSKLSYGMYLNHFIILPSSTKWALDHFSAVTSYYPAVYLGGLAIGIGISVAGAAITYLLIESPFLQLREVYVKHAAH